MTAFPDSQTFQLLLTLLSIPPPSAYLVQNPPSIPALAAVWLAARLRGAAFLIDWHNFGYTVLEQSKGWSNSHPMVVAAYWYEYAFGACGDGHLCVTAAMQGWLRDTWGITATVLHDRAPPAFVPPSPAAVHELLQRVALPSVPGVTVGEGQTVLTDGGGWRSDRPALLLSSTSWTPDEDFGILLEALVQYDGVAGKDPRLPALLVVVTGKGPQ